MAGMMLVSSAYLFFFQAEDGIRDIGVTGVQTCALPISMIGRLRVLRQWAGNVDMTMDGSPIIDRTPVQGLYFNGGWCYGGFKGAPPPPLSFSPLSPPGVPPQTAAPLPLERFPPRPFVP